MKKLKKMYFQAAVPGRNGIKQIFLEPRLNEKAEENVFLGSRRGVKQNFSVPEWNQQKVVSRHQALCSFHAVGCNSHKDQALRQSKTIVFCNQMRLILMTVASGDVVRCNSHGDQALRCSKTNVFYNISLPKRELGVKKKFSRPEWGQTKFFRAQTP